MSGKKYKYIMKFIVWIINYIHIEFNDIHWEGCLHNIITRCLSISGKGNNLTQFQEWHRDAGG